jgi:hypothetical protein
MKSDLVSTTDRQTSAGSWVEYRPLSVLAVSSGVLGGLSVLAWIAPPLVAVATIAALCGGISVLRLWGRSADVAGIRLAIDW